MTKCPRFSIILASSRWNAISTNFLCHQWNGKPNLSLFFINKFRFITYDLVSTSKNKLLVDQRYSNSAEHICILQDSAHLYYRDEYPSRCLKVIFIVNSSTLCSQNLKTPLKHQKPRLIALKFFRKYHESTLLTSITHIN